MKVMGYYGAAGHPVATRLATASTGRKQPVFGAATPQFKAEYPRILSGYSRDDEEKLITNVFTRHGQPLPDNYVDLLGDVYEDMMQIFLDHDARHDGSLSGKGYSEDTPFNVAFNHIFGCQPNKVVLGSYDARDDHHNSSDHPPMPKQFARCALLRQLNPPNNPKRPEVLLGAISKNLAAWYRAASGLPVADTGPLLSAAISDVLGFIAQSEPLKPLMNTLMFHATKGYGYQLNPIIAEQASKKSFDYAAFSKVKDHVYSHSPEQQAARSLAMKFIDRLLPQFAAAANTVFPAKTTATVGKQTVSSTGFLSGLLSGNGGKKPKPEALLTKPSLMVEGVKAIETKAGQEQIFRSVLSEMVDEVVMKPFQ